MVFGSERESSPAGGAFRGPDQHLSQCHTIHDQLFQPGRYLVVKKTLKRAIGQPNIKRNNRTTHIVCLSTETFPLTVVGEQVNYMGCFQRHSLKHQN